MRAKIFLIFTLTLFAATFLRAATNSVVWNFKTDRVSADVRGSELWPLLEDIAHATGWHIFVEPDTARKVDVKFSNLPSGDALHKLLGDLNFAFVPKTNEPSQLYVFTTRMENATQPVVRINAIAKAGPQKHKPNQLIVKLKPGADIDALAKSLGAKVIERDDKLGIYLLEFPDAAATDAALALLKNNSDVAAVDYNYIYDAPPAPMQASNLTAPATRLTLDPTSSGDPCNPVIGLIDTAVSPTGNSALDQFMLKPISVTGTSTATSTGLTHGTAMYQTILNAISQAGNGHTGTKILPVQVFDDSETASTWSVALGVQAAVNNGATVLNMSLGGTADSAILDDVIQQALAKGVVIFAAAGNQPVTTPTYPAAIYGVNAVTALSAPGQLAAYANYGNFVSMALPGTSLVLQNGQTWIVQGTSPATAYATGVAVGTKSVNCAGWSQIESAMEQKFTVPSK